jgi:hypothetical protein
VACGELKEKRNEWQATYPRADWTMAWSVPGWSLRLRWVYESSWVRSIQWIGQVHLIRCPGSGEDLADTRIAFAEEEPEVGKGASVPTLPAEERAVHDERHVFLSREDEEQEVRWVG